MIALLLPPFDANSGFDYSEAVSLSVACYLTTGTPYSYSTSRCPPSWRRLPLPSEFEQQDGSWEQSMAG